MIEGILGIQDWLPAFQQLAWELPEATAVLLIPTALLYLSILAHLKNRFKTYLLLTASSIATFLACPWLAPVHCGPFRCLQNFAIAIGTMKLLDILTRCKELPTYTASETRPPDWLLAFIMLTELRYESFAPNYIRVPKAAENFSEPTQLALHIGAFAILQAMPQDYLIILAYEVLLAIYIIWTVMQLTVRYKGSPSLFGPLYLADSLTGFWSETWHNVFASPCQSLAYRPARNLSRYGVPAVIARSLGVMGAFGLMAIFHIYALQPILPRSSLRRIGLFFLYNGIATVGEAAVWGRKKHWTKTLIAWTFETCLAAWTVQAAYIPRGLDNVPWKDFCGRVEEF
ncbi:MAG: hypothetical protein M1837_005844 [Sclerophora amabilis]|nr:MAG: hypothetical protein M1837_005844 [Sclerophora amabilis]